MALRDTVTGEPIEDGKVTVQHTPSVASHFNKIGYNTSKAERAKFYNDENNLGVTSKENNSREGGESKEVFRQDTGPNYSR